MKKILFFFILSLTVCSNSFADAPLTCENAKSEAKRLSEKENRTYAEDVRFKLALKLLGGCWAQI